MRGVNHVVVGGNLGSDPELRYTQNGKAVSTVSVAVNEQWGPADNQKKTTWVRVTMWEKMAENAAQYLSKGDPILYVGRLTENRWTDKEGKERVQLEVIAREMHFIGGGGKGKSASSSNGGGGKGQQQRSDDPPPPQDDDIPF